MVKHHAQIDVVIPSAAKNLALRWVKLKAGWGVSWKKESERDSSPSADGSE
jgi:hypothetical protein